MGFKYTMLLLQLLELFNLYPTELIQYDPVSYSVNTERLLWTKTIQNSVHVAGDFYVILNRWTSHFTELVIGSENETVSSGSCFRKLNTLCRIHIEHINQNKICYRKKNNTESYSNFN